MATFEIPLPSGLVIEAKSLHGRDVIAIAERVGAGASGDTIGAFMTACTTRVLDPGPYPYLDGGQSMPDWKRSLWGDLLYGIIKLRIESFPEHKGTFDFEFSCPHCKALTPGTIDLAEFLSDEDHFRPLPVKSREILLANGLFETKTPSGTRVKFDLARAAQDDPMKVLMKRNQRTKTTDVEEIAKRLKWVEGLRKGRNNEEATDLLSLWNWTKNLDTNDLDALLSEMGAADILVDAKILAWCRSTETECGRQCRISLPLDLGFFRPRSATKKASTAKDEDSERSSPA